jgi:Cu(I)/Ag(I) efflux system membrane fusion protein
MTKNNSRDIESPESNNRRTRSPLSLVPKPLWWMMLGGLLVVLVSVPLGLQPMDGWIHQLLGHRGAHQAVASAEPTLWTCPMHPDILMEEPGSCPICGMDLVPVASATEVSTETHAPSQGDAQLWTCGMHPEVIQDEPGQCPICGMNLVPVRDEGGTVAAVPAGERKILFYRNPMDPGITSPVPRKDDMGMDYVPVYGDEAASAAAQGAVVTINPAVQQNMNVITERVTRRDISHRIRTVGSLDYDQEKMVSVTTKYPGFIEKTYINYIGQPVTKGEALFEIYAPELVQTEQELLAAVRYVQSLAEAPEETRARAEALRESARQRLGYWDISAEQIRRLEETGEVFRTLQVVAPSNGVVMKRMPGLEGMATQPGMELLHIADLSNLWLTVEVFDEQLSWLDIGSLATVTLSYFPGVTFRGRVRYIEPEVSEMTRTVQLTLDVPNRDRRLRAGMYATVVFEPVAVTDAIAVPAESIIRTGERDVVIVALGDGRFAPREVVLGPRSDGFIQVLEGLNDGDEVVTSAQFLIDSESNLREAIQKMIAAKRSGGQ